MKRIYLVDVSSLFFRAFYAVRPLTSPKGLPVNAIYGFMSMLLKLMKDEKPDTLVFCHDLKEPSFRKDLYTEYKANRSEMPEDLAPQIPYIKKIAGLLGIPALEKVGFEADDIIGTLTRLGRKNGYEIYIVSGDKDFAQLIEPHVFLLDTMKNVKIGPAEAKEKWGVNPDQMIDYLALVGDSSDNVPGVRGIGPKGACKLLEEYGSLDGVYENIEAIKGSTQEKLKAHKEEAYLSQKLVTIVTDVPVSTDMNDYHLKNPDQAAVRDFLNELNFKGFEKTIMDLPHWNGIEEGPVVSGVSREPAQTEAADVAPKAASIGEESEGKKKSSKKTAKAKDETAEETKPTPGLGARSASQQSFDLRVEGDAGPGEFPIEEVSLTELKKKLGHDRSVWGFTHEQGFFFGLEDGKELWHVKDDPEKIGQVLSPLDLRWRGFNVKTMWHQLGLQAPTADWDAMLAAYIVRAGESTDWSRIFARATGEPPKELPTPSEKWRELRDLELALKREMGMGERVFREIDLPLLPILYKMERRGVLIDKKMLKIQGDELGEEIGVLEKKIHELAQGPFNVASPKQLAGILFEKLGLPSGKKTKTGFSTDNEVLEKLKDKHPIAELVLQYRELTKLKSTYVDALPTMIKEDGRIHTTFNQAHTATGRLSSVDPNLQNIPIRTDRGARVRRAFCADEGNALMSVDYSQIELRILAHYSSDKNLIQAFNNDLDIHAATASEVFGLKLADVKPEHRRVAKAVNFGIAYGQGAFGLADVLGIPRSEAQDIIKRYFERFSGVKTYIEETIKSATEKGYVETLDGRRRYMDELKSASPALRKFGERAAINAPIQGTASDLVKKAMIEVDKIAQSDMLLQVHDELVFEAPAALLKEEAPRIVQTMEKIASLKVPLKANWGIGPNWDEAH